MALQKPINLGEAFGLAYTFDGYCAIQSVSVERKTDGLKIARALILIFADKAAKNAGLNPVAHDQVEYMFDADAPDNLYSLTYAHLKTLPRYAGAQDV